MQIQQQATHQYWLLTHNFCIQGGYRPIFSWLPKVIRIFVIFTFLRLVIGYPNVSQTDWYLSGIWLLPPNSLLLACIHLTGESMHREVSCPITQRDDTGQGSIPDNSLTTVYDWNSLTMRPLRLPVSQNNAGHSFNMTYLKMAMSKLSSRILATSRNSAIITVTSVPPISS